MPSHASHNLAYTPISKSPVSEFLRQCNVHHIISGHLKAFVDRSPFILCGGAGKTIDCQQMDKISEELLKGAGLRGESVWRILTLGGLGSEGSLKTEQRGASPQVDVVVKSVIKALQPMMLEGGLSAVETTLSAIFNMAEAVWSARRKDSCQLMISTDPADNPHLWKAVPELHPEPIEPKLAVSADIQLQYMCTFPRIIGSFLKNDEVVRTVLHQGEMLPSDAQALQGGLQEWSEIRQAAEEGARNKRSEHSRRKTSLTRPIEETMPRLTTGAFDVDPR